MNVPEDRCFRVRVSSQDANAEAVRNALLCADRAGPGWIYPRLEVDGARDGERVRLSLAFYDGADPDRPGKPGAYQVRSYDLATSGARALQLAVHLPAKYSGWAVREVHCGGWTWPFTVEAEGQESPGMTPVTDS